jgi:hypothetical protein
VSEGPRDGVSISPGGEAPNPGSVQSDGAEAARPSGGGTNGLQLQPVGERVIITATLNVTAEEVSKRFEDVGNIAAAAGGFVASSSFGNDEDRQTASVTIRVPNDRYQEVLADLRALGDVESERSESANVTGEFTDLESRLRNLRATEERYTEFLLQAQNINEVLTVQDRLNATRAEIEQVQGRINLLSNQTELATVTVHIDEPVAGATTQPAGERSLVDVMQESFEASLAVLTGIAVVALAVIAFSWWLVPFALAGLYYGRRQLQRDRQPTPPAAP